MVLGGLSGRKILSRLPSAQRYHNESCYHNSCSDLGKGCLSVPHCPGQLHKNFTLSNSLPISMIISPLSFSISQMRRRSPVQFSSSSLMCIPPSRAVWAHWGACSGGGLFSPPHFSIPMCLSRSVLQGHRAPNLWHRGKSKWYTCKKTVLETSWNGTHFQQRPRSSLPRVKEKSEVQSWSSAMRKGQSWTPADGLTSAVTFSWTVGVLELMLSLFVTYLLFDLGASLEGPLLCTEGTLCRELPLIDSVALLQWFLTDVWRTHFDDALPAQSIILAFIILLLCLPYAQYTHLFEIENRAIINHVQDCTEHYYTFIDLSVMFFELKHVSPSVVLRGTAITIAKNASLRPHHRLCCQFLSVGTHAQWFQAFGERA